MIEGVAESRANLKNLGRNFDRHCDDDEKRHAQNIERLDKIEERLSDICDVLKPLSDGYAVMRPIVEGYQVTRLKFAGGVAVALFIAGALGWLAVSVISKAIELAFKKVGL